MNALKTGILLTAMTVLLMAIGGLIGKGGGMVIAFFIALVMNAVSYWFSDKIVLAMYHAKPISESESPELYSMISRLTTKASLPMPKLYLIEEDSPNAFATGRDPQHAAVAVTQGLLSILGSDEIEGVIAHELAHVKNRDILISSMAATLAGAVMMLANMARWGALLGGLGGGDRRDENGGIIGLLAAAIVAPIAALMIQMAISRSREYQADATGAGISGKPLGLANALLKLDSASKYVASSASPATAHMFIVNPLKGGFGGLFSTHPSTNDRVSRLKDIAQKSGQH